MPKKQVDFIDIGFGLKSSALKMLAQQLLVMADQKNHIDTVTLNLEGSIYYPNTVKKSKVSIFLIRK